MENPNGYYAHYNKYRESLSQRSKEYYQKNKEAIKEKKRQIYYEQRDKKQSYQREYHQKHRERNNKIRSARMKNSNEAKRLMAIAIDVFE